MMARKPLDTLVKCLQDHDIAIDYVDLQKSIDGEHGPAIEAWIKEYLGAQTLLSRDELSLYSSLQKSGDVEALEGSHDLSLVRGLGDQELQIAIEDLRKSTAAVEKQTEILRVQQDAMSSLIKSDSRYNEARSTMNRAQHKVWTTGFQTISNEVEEMIQSLTFQGAEVGAQHKVAQAGLDKIASEVLRSDDKLLSSLQKLASNLEPAQPEDDENIQRLRDLCARLIKYTVEGVRCRLDKIYLGAVNAHPSSTNSGIAEDSEVTALREELESLYSEILPVAQMSAEQHYLEPALRAISEQDVRGKHRSQKSLTYISECLTFLIRRLEAFTSRTEEYQSHHLATSHLLAAVHVEIDAPPPLSPLKGGKAASTSGPSRRKKSQSKSKPSSPVRPRTTRRRSSATSFDDETPAEQQLLRNLGISFPGTMLSERAVAKEMADALAERSAKLALHARSVQEGSEAAIASHLHDAYATLELLRNSLLSETRHKTVLLMDKEVEEAIGHLEAEVEDVKSKLGAVDVSRLKESNVRRNELVERWSR